MQPMYMQLIMSHPCVSRAQHRIYNTSLNIHHYLHKLIQLIMVEHIVWNNINSFLLPNFILKKVNNFQA